MFMVVPAFTSAVRPASRSDRAKMAAALVLTSNSGRTLLCGALAVNCGNAAPAAATACRRAARRCSSTRAQPTNHQGVDDDVWAYDEILPPLSLFPHPRGSWISLRGCTKRVLQDNSSVAVFLQPALEYSLVCDLRRLLAYGHES